MLLGFLKAKVEKFANRADKMAGVNATLKFLDDEGLYPDFHAIESGVNEAECVVDGKKYLMFCSNNYLSLSENPEVKKAAQDAIEEYGVGPGGSRVISGDVTIIRELEKAIADLVGKEDCLTFPTGYMANIAVFQALMDPLFYGMPAKSSDSVIFSDEYNHGSIVDGCRLSKAKKVIFKHNNLEDLAKKIKENDLPNKLIVTEGVFSLDGEILNLPKYVELAQRSNSLLMIDDAHGVGVIGKEGGGVVDYHSCAEGVDILMGCMDKSFGGTGGFLCGSKRMMDFLRIASRSSILSSSLPVGMAGGMIKSVELIKKGVVARERIVANANYLKDGLREVGFTVVGDDPIPAVALHIGTEAKGISFANKLWDEQIFSPVIRWPAVPEGSARFRILVMSSHTRSQIDRFVTACNKIGRELDLIP